MRKIPDRLSVNHIGLLILIIIYLIQGCTASVPVPATPTNTPLLPDPEIEITRNPIPQNQLETIHLTPISTNTPVYTKTNEKIVNIVFQSTPTLLISDNQPELESVSYSVPFIPQEGLQYKGAPTTAGCTAASAQMIMDYWKAQNPLNKTLSAQRLIDINASQGTFNRATGLSMTNLIDEFSLLGYQVVTSRNSSKESLVTALKEFGPQAVIVKAGWVPTGPNHLVVISGFNAEDDQIMINDPWYDAPLVLSWEGFDGIWSLNYSERENGYLVRTFFTVTPVKEE